MLRLWRRNVWTVKKVSGDTRIWTMDLSDCSRLLYHWAISPRGDKVFRRERQVAMMSWFQSHLAAKKSYGAVRLKVLQYSDLPVSVGGIMVSIAAFQAVDPGSIPGQRRIFWAIHFFLESKVVNLILTFQHRHTVSESYKYIDWWQRIWNQYTKVMHAYGDREKTPWTRVRNGVRGRQYWDPEYRWYDNHPGMGQSRTQLFSFLLRYAAVNNWPECSLLGFSNHFTMLLLLREKQCRQIIWLNFLLWLQW